MNHFSYKYELIMPYQHRMIEEVSTPINIDALIEVGYIYI
jgi:hypothetical protein